MTTDSHAYRTISKHPTSGRNFGSSLLPLKNETKCHQATKSLEQLFKNSYFVYTQWQIAVERLRDTSSNFSVETDGLICRCIDLTPGLVWISSNPMAHNPVIVVCIAAKGFLDFAEGMAMMNQRQHTGQHGVTLAETLVVLAISGILLGFAVPSYRDMIERNRLRQAAESFKSDLQFARSEALKMSQNIVVSRQAGNAGNWCYGLAIRTASKTSCNCSETDPSANNFCDVKRITGDNFEQTTLEASIINNNTFNFRRGTTNAGGATFSTAHYAVRIVFSDVGRVRLCTPNPLPAGKWLYPTFSLFADFSNQLYSDYETVTIKPTYKPRRHAGRSDDRHCHHRHHRRVRCTLLPRNDRAQSIETSRRSAGSRFAMDAHRSDKT